MWGCAAWNGAGAGSQGRGPGLGHAEACRGRGHEGRTVYRPCGWAAQRCGREREENRCSGMRCHCAACVSALIRRALCCSCVLVSAACDGKLSCGVVASALLSPGELQAVSSSRLGQRCSMWHTHGVQPSACFAGAGTASLLSLWELWRALPPLCVLWCGAALWLRSWCGAVWRGVVCPVVRWWRGVVLWCPVVDAGSP